MREWFWFWWQFIKIGREYWKKRGLWSILAYLDQTASLEGPLSTMSQVWLASMREAEVAARSHSIADDVEAWLGRQTKTNPEVEGDGA